MLQNIWNDIEKWYEENSPTLLEELKSSSSASTQEIIFFERTISSSLPEDYKISIQIHNGGTYINGYQYNSLEQTLKIWTAMKKLKDDGVFSNADAFFADGEKIKKNWWCSGWIPFSKDYGGNLHCIDTTPENKGIFGQIIYWDAIDGPILSQYDSFLKWLEHYRDDLYQGLYQIDEGGLLIRK
jgi:cell wall assembly regulator SMI1